MSLGFVLEWPHFPPTPPVSLSNDTPRGHTYFLLGSRSFELQAKQTRVCATGCCVRQAWVCTTNWRVRQTCVPDNPVCSQARPRPRVRPTRRGSRFGPTAPKRARRLDEKHKCARRVDGRAVLGPIAPRRARRLDEKHICARRVDERAVFGPDGAGLPKSGHGASTRRTNEHGASTGGTFWHGYGPRRKRRK